MAIDLKLNDDWDLDLVDGDLVLIQDRPEVLQSVKIRLLFIKFEWAYDFTLGIPWGHGMFDVRVPRVKKEHYLKEGIIETLGVRALTAFEFNIDREENGAFVAFTAETIYGPIEGEVTV
jgi:hypothetical protein